MNDNEGSDLLFYHPHTIRILRESAHLLPEEITHDCPDGNEQPEDDQVLKRRFEDSLEEIGGNKELKTDQDACGERPPDVVVTLPPDPHLPRQEPDDRDYRTIDNKKRPKYPERRPGNLDSRFQKRARAGISMPVRI